MTGRLDATRLYIEPCCTRRWTSNISCATNKNLPSFLASAAHTIYEICHFNAGINLRAFVTVMMFSRAAASDGCIAGLLVKFFGNIFLFPLSNLKLQRFENKKKFEFIKAIVRKERIEDLTLLAHPFSHESS